jgi:hypothetical protein
LPEAIRDHPSQKRKWAERFAGYTHISSNRAAFSSLHSLARIHADHTPPSPAPAPRWRRSPLWTASLCPTRLLNHWHRHAGHECIHHMAVPEDVGRDLSPAELLSARNFLGPGLSCQAVYRPEHVLVHRCPEFRSGKSHTWPGWMLSRMTCKVPCLTRSAPLHSSDC